MTFKETFVAFDEFSHPVGLNFKGKDVYQTKLGALFSLLMRLFILTYAVTKMLKLVQR